MKKSLAFVLTSLGLFALLAPNLFAEDGAKPEVFRVMSYNILRAATDMENDWGERKAILVEDIKATDPDLFGVQEAEFHQMEYLIENLPDYEYIGAGRDDGERGGEFCAVFYKKDEFDLLDSGTFWLSQTPDEPGRKGWDAACNRVVSWGKFQVKGSGKTFVYANTHFDHMGPVARIESAKMVVSFQKKVASDLPFFISGDFNATDDTNVYQTIVKTLKDARKTVENATGGDWTFPSDVEEGKTGVVIDYIFTNDQVKVKSFRIHSDPSASGIHSSDHYSIDAELEF